MAFKVQKVLTSLPSPLEANTVYFVQVGNGFDLYCTDNAGSIAYRSNNIQADWTATGGQSQILNKPTLGTAAALDVGVGANDVVQLDGTGKLPAVDGSQLTNIAPLQLTDSIASTSITTAATPNSVKTAYDLAASKLDSSAVSSFALTLLDDADAAAVRTTLAAAAIASPSLTGIPTAPTAAVNTDTTQLATTAFVQAQIGVTLVSPSFSGTPTAPTAAVDTNTTQLATTAFVQTQIGASVLDSPAFSGVPTAPTAAVDTNTTQLATTAFVQTQIGTLADQSGAPLDSPAFTGTPTAPTAAVNNNTTQLATTAFVQTQIAARFTRNITAVAALNIDCSSGNYFTKTISSNSTFTFSNAPSGVAYAFTLEVTHSGGTITWPSSVKWSIDTAPTLTTGKTHLFIFVTDNGGSRWRGAALVDYTN